MGEKPSDFALYRVFADYAPPPNPVIARGFGRGPMWIRTGDRGFRAWKTPLWASVSVAEFGGSDSLCAFSKFVRRTCSGFRVSVSGPYACVFSIFVRLDFIGLFGPALYLHPRMIHPIDT